MLGCCLLCFMCVVEVKGGDICEFSKTLTDPSGVFVSPYLSRGGLSPGGEFYINYDSYLVMKEAPNVGPGVLCYKYGKSVDFPLVLPSNCLVELLVTSEDVIHSWTVEGLGVKCDAIPGRLNAVYLKDLRPGFSGWGGCSEMCGLNHWQMGIEVEVLLEKDFYEWALCLLYGA